MSLGFSSLSLQAAQMQTQSEPEVSGASLKASADPGRLDDSPYYVCVYKEQNCVFYGFNTKFCVRVSVASISLQSLVACEC